MDGDIVVRVRLGMNVELPRDMYSQPMFLVGMPPDHVRYTKLNAFRVPDLGFLVKLARASTLEAISGSRRCLTRSRIRSQGDAEGSDGPIRKKGRFEKDQAALKKVLKRKMQR